nr:C40 family peptidase [Fodinicola feengrottensis]
MFAGGDARGPTTGTEPGIGFDCSGLTLYAWAQVGVSLPHTASGQHRLGQPVPPGREQPGDLVFFHTSGDQPDYYHHVGIALGGGLMIDAPHSGAVVRIEQIWPAEYAGARRY